MTVSDLLADKSCWTQKSFARTKRGADCSASSRYATAFCLSGALRRCYPQITERQAAFEKLMCAMERAGYRPRVHGLVSWNDAKDRKWSDVKKVIRMAKV